MSGKRETARQFGRMSRAYAESAPHARGPDLERVVTLLDPSPGMAVLDVATGAGHTALAVAPRAGRVVAADISPEMIGEMRRMARNRGIANLWGAVMDAENLAFADRTFDGLTSRIAPHHFPDLPRAVAEMARVLKPGGRCVIEDSTVPDDQGLDRFLNAVEALRDPTHIRSWTAAEWQAVVEAAGLRLTVVERHRKRHRIADWLSRGGLDRPGEERVYAAFAAAPPEARSYFEITFETGRPAGYTDDKLIFRAEKD